MGRFLKIAAACAIASGTIAAPAWAGNPVNGAKVFASQCAACHGNRANAPQPIGPRLYGVVGRHAGSSPGFNYSTAMKGSGLTWTPSELRIYLNGPAKVVKGTKMPYAGLHNPTQLDDLIAYLDSLR